MQYVRPPEHFDTDKTRLASKTDIEILSISCFVLHVVIADGCQLAKKNQNDCI